jgi:energy-coupling factor transporter ATP-binding protein EcfA2
MKRPSELNVFVGFNGTGKSTLIQKFIDIEVEKRKGRVLIVVPDPIEWRHYPEVNLADPACFRKMSSPQKIIFEPGVLEIIAGQYDGFRDGLLVFDDCRAYTKPNIQEALRTLIIRRRQRSHDIIAAGHGITEIPPVFITYANRYTIFYTQDNPDRRKEELGIAFEQFKQAAQDVNAKFNDDPHYFKIINARVNV